MSVPQPRFRRSDKGRNGSETAPPILGALVAKPKILIVRGHQANPWDLRPWTLLGEDFDISFLKTESNWFDVENVDLEGRPARTLRDVLPKGRIGDLAARVPGDRYLRPEQALHGFDIVHTQELGYWYSAQAARPRRALGFKLVLTVWETLPFVDSYRNVRTRPLPRGTCSRAPTCSWPRPNAPRPR